MERRILMNLIVALFGVIIYCTLSFMVYINKSLEASSFLKSIGVIFILIFQIFYFITFSIENIGYRKFDDSKFLNFLFRYLGIVILIIFSFTTSFWMLYKIDINSFNNYDFGSNVFEELFNFFYFSCVTFSTIGYGEILPTSIFSKLLVIIESFTSLFTIVFIISNFSTIRDSLNKR